MTSAVIQFRISNLANVIDVEAEALTAQGATTTLARVPRELVDTVKRVQLCAIGARKLIVPVVVGASVIVNVQPFGSLEV